MNDVKRRGRPRKVNLDPDGMLGSIPVPMDMTKEDLSAWIAEQFYPKTVAVETEMDIDDTPMSGTQVYPSPPIRMIRPYGFVDDEGLLRFWPQGQMVDDPDQIRLIIDHGCRDWE